MQKTNAKILIALLLTAMALPLIPMASASTGFIYINPSTVPPLPALPAPSTPGQQIPAGGNVNLYTGGVTWSGGQIYLILSKDGFSQVSANDLPYSATFNLANITQNAVSTYTNSIGTWTVGYNWINGSIPLDIAGGNYFIKAFDGTAAQIAVTDTYITVIAAFRVSPTSGAPGAPITLRGYAFPANALVNLTYTAAPYITGVQTIQNLTEANELGAFTVTIAAPDLKQAGATGSNPIANGTITFYAVNNATGVTYNGTYTEFFRGLLQVKNLFPGSGNVYGNNTDFTSNFNVTVGSSLRLAGIYFYASGALTFMWDGSINITPAAGVATNGTGFFNTTVTIPSTPMGAHNLTIIDANGQVFRIVVYVEPKLTLSPTKGPVGTTVTATGTGFPATSGTTVINATLSWAGLTPYVASTFTDSTGSFTTTFVVPQAAGGTFNIMAYSNATGSFVWLVNASFTVTPSFYVTPDTFSNSGSQIVLAWGTGFNPALYYSVNIDNTYLAFDAINQLYYPSVIRCNGTGYLSFEFVGTGFRPGQHVVSLYANGTSTVAAWATFNVTTTADSIAGMLTNMNDTIVSTNTNVNAVKTDVGTIKTDVSSIKATVVSIDGNVATVKTDVGTIKTDVSSIKATVTSIDGKVATVQTNLGTVTTSVSSINAQITSISNGIANVQTSLGSVQTKLTNIDPVIGVIAGDTAAIQTTLGTITTSISAINPVLTSIEDGIATVKTDIGTLQGTVTSIKDGVATIQTNLGTLSVNVGALQTDVTSTKDNTAGLSTLIYVAIVLALIAAIAAIASIFLMRQKIAS